MRFTAKTSIADFSDGINDDDDDVGVVNDGDGLAWVLAKDPTVCVAHTPRDGSSATVHNVCFVQSYGPVVKNAL